VPHDELIPETRFTALGDSRIAYQVFGDGPVDLLVVESVGVGIDTNWYWPAHAIPARSRHPGPGDHVRPTGHGSVGLAIG
jgi:hypothetical protein